MLFMLISIERSCLVSDNKFGGNKGVNALRMRMQNN